MFNLNMPAKFISMVYALIVLKKKRKAHVYEASGVSALCASIDTIVDAKKTSAQ